MDRDFRQGHLEIDFPTEPFHSAFRLLVRSAVLYFASLRFLAAITLIVSALPVPTVRRTSWVAARFAVNWMPVCAYWRPTAVSINSSK